MAPTVTGTGPGSLSAVAKPSIAGGATSTVSSDDTIFGVPKWALAVAAGGVVAIGLAYYVLSAPDGTSKKSGKKKKEKVVKNQMVKCSITWI